MAIARKQAYAAYFESGLTKIGFYREHLVEFLTMLVYPMCSPSTSVFSGWSKRS